ncbi:MAG: phosphoribosylglycinamide formyltransferase [Ardenticatenaceae bacterium]|nr:phosphoribosylglycinamide formyltransferase [Anaerolineales bacterium]MCB8922232.1 phosphoribosylglycinamide formyltransferase [Ardenticatenaceae bacterium]MCB8990583.1 phosphoribosylglycinamide formyltransferase [Ardenticatenaceae bacterium]
MAANQPSIVVMISGSGTNLQALIDAVANGRLPAKIVGVVSNRKAAYGLARAEQAGISTRYLPFKPYKDVGKSRDAYDADLAAEVAAFQPDLIVLAGWMHILSPIFLNQFAGRVINLHPALPGQFAGTHAIERAYDAFQRGEIEHSGCMVHVAIPEVDAGEVVVSRQVYIHKEDTLADFEARMHEAEHELIVIAADRALMRQQGVTATNMLARVDAAWVQWQALLAQISAAHLTEPALSGGWAVKDVIAHLAWFEREMADLINQRALVGSDLWLLSIDEQNAVIYEQNRERPLPDIQAEAAQSHADMRAALLTLDAAALQDAAYFTHMPSDWRPWEVIAGNSYEHYLDHMPSIRHWLATTFGGRND